MDNQGQARSLPERREAALERLHAGGNLWLATASDRGPHLIPVSYWWDGARLTTSTFENSRTLMNMKTQPTIRASVRSTSDVVMIDATAVIMAADDVDDAAKDGYAHVSRIPRGAQGFIYVQLLPKRIDL